MSDLPPLLQQTLRYLEFLRAFEKELYLSQPLNAAQISVRNVVQDQPAKKTKPEKESGLNPYPAYAPFPSLSQMHETVRGCLKCKLGASRTNFVFGVGSAEAKVVFIGEGPGQEEDLRGEPFVGRAGVLLNKMLAEIGWRREEVYICNVIKCRPPGNRDPLPEEIAQCEPYLHEQLRLLNPPWLVSLGRIAAQTLLQNKLPLKAMRGRVHQYRGLNLWVTYHPAAILRNENLMPDAHRDLLTLKRMVESGSSHPES